MLHCAAKRRCSGSACHSCATLGLAETLRGVILRCKWADQSMRVSERACRWSTVTTGFLYSLANNSVEPPLSLILSTVCFSHFAHFFSISSLTLCSPTEAPLPEAILLIHGNMHEIIFSGPTPVLVSDKICILCKVNFIVCEPSAFAINANPTKQIENRVYVSPQPRLRSYDYNSCRVKRAWVYYAHVSPAKSGHYHPPCNLVIVELFL